MQRDDVALGKCGTGPTNDVVSIRGRLYSRSSFQLRNIDPDEAKYLQQYPLVNGPVRKMNQRIRRKIGDLSNWHIRVSDTPAERINCRQFDLQQITPADARALLAIDAPLHDIAKHIWNFVNVKERLARPGVKVLCAGAGNGLECRIASALNPTAEVVGTDFKIEANPYHPNMRELPHTELAGEFGPESFDIVYSNHTLEHIYNDVGQVLANIYTVLKPGGCFLSALPCEASPSNPVKNRLPELIRKNSRFGYLASDPGHPWKTDVFDIYDKLSDAGFQQIDFYYMQGSFEDNIAAVSKWMVPNMTADASQPMSADESDRLFKRFWRFAKYLVSNPNPFEIALKLYCHRASRCNDKNLQTNEVAFTCSK